uniref:Uncharacterized protein n=1 Tax=Rhizophora mucronata TaxID=61149 RepID=A0A2P2PMM2_RHIMU
MISCVHYHIKYMNTRPILKKGQLKWVVSKIVIAFQMMLSKGQKDPTTYIHGEKLAITF